MEQARVAAGGLGAGLLDEPEQLGPARAERGRPALAAQQLEADLAAVVAEGAVEVAHGEVDGAHARRGRDGDGGRGHAGHDSAGR